MENKPTFIEYASFFGSIQIFKYLILNNVDLISSVWYYAIHSQNAEIIQILIDNNVEFPNKDVNLCIDEAIKCHHNEIANYLIDIFSKEIKNYESAFRNYN